MSLGPEDDPSITGAFASGTTGAGNVGFCVLERILAETAFEDAAKRLESNFDFDERRLARFQHSCLCCAGCFRGGACPDCHLE